MAMDSTMADLRPAAVRALRDLKMGVVEKWKLKDLVEFFGKLHIKFQIYYPRGLPLARISSPYLRKIVKRVPGRMVGCHQFREVDTAAAYISDKCHLGAVGKDVKPWLMVPTDVKELFGAVLRENNLKCSLNARTGNVNISKTNSKVDISEGDCLLENSGFNRKYYEVGTSSHEDSSEREVKKSVGRFFYGSGHQFKDVEETFFLEMVSCFFGHGPIMNNIPSLKELKGWILEDSFASMQRYVKEIRKTWETTGCSILLDGWIYSLTKFFRMLEWRTLFKSLHIQLQ